MRRGFVIPVLLGLSLIASSAAADRWHRDHNTRARDGRPDRPGLALERSRPGDEQVRVSVRREAPAVREQGRAVGRATLGARPAMPQGRVSLHLNMSSRKACNEADECSMSDAGVKAAVSRAAQTRATGIGMEKVNNAKGKSLLGRAAPGARTSFNEIGESNGMGKFAAQAVVFKAAHSRSFGIGMEKINNAKGKSLLGRAAQAERVACNEADGCSMGNFAVDAIWQKAKQERKH